MAYSEDLQVSGYPSDGMAANVSKDTTMRELISIDGIDKDVFMLQNINLFFGAVNNIEYGNTMMGLPSIYDVESILKKKKI